MKVPTYSWNGTPTLLEISVELKRAQAKQSDVVGTEPGVLSMTW